MTLFNTFIRSPYNYDMSAASDESAYYPEGESMTQQSFKEECDINTIIRNFGLMGEVPATLKTPMEGDFTMVTDFHTAMNLITQAQEGFMTLPAEVREQFQNNPGDFVAFASDPANLPKLKEMGLGAIERPDPLPLPVRVIADPVAPPDAPATPT